MMLVDPGTVDFYTGSGEIRPKYRDRQRSARLSSLMVSERTWLQILNARNNQHKVSDFTGETVIRNP